MEREQIIKALECCTIGDCYPCPYGNIGAGCRDKMDGDALTLIFELTEENEAWQKQLISQKEISDKAYYELACEVENLRAENERLSKYLDDHFPKCIYQYDGDVQEYCVLGPCGKFKTVAEFQKQIEADTVRKMHSMLCEGRVSNDNVVIVANQVAKEMLEET